MKTEGEGRRLFVLTEDGNARAHTEKAARSVPDNGAPSE